MGLLDDAIREHLELKRRRGADPDEVARQENEALGDPRAPAARGAEPPGADLEAGAGVTAVTPPAPDPEATGAPAGDDADEEDPVAAVAAGDEPTSARPEAAREPEPWLADEPPTAEHPPPAPAEPEDVAPDAAPGADDDVLEETPDFLQETPEHDRLWFEQKPPRDFDFDN